MIGALAIDTNYVNALINKGNALTKVVEYNEPVNYYYGRSNIEPGYTLLSTSEGTCPSESSGKYEAIKMYDIYQFA